MQVRPVRVAPLGAFWFVFFGGLGIFYPYFALYLREQGGLSGAQIGIVMATIPLVGILAQPVWGHLADRTGARSTLLALLTAETALGFLALAYADQFTAFVLATAVFACGGTAVLPMSLAVTFAAVRGRGPHAFGLVRMWGTIGYLLTVALFPPLLAIFSPPNLDGTPAGLRSMFYAAALCSLIAASFWPWLPRHGEAAVRAPGGHWRELLRSAAVRRLLLFTLGCYLFTHGPMALFPLLVRARGGDLGTVGTMWVVMLLVEIPLIAFSGTGLRRLGARGLLTAGVLAGGVRWTLCAFAGDLTALYAVQLLHGVVVAGLMLGAPLYLEAVVPQDLRSTAQALLSTVGVGVGGIVSNVAAGWLIDRFGVAAPFLIGGIGAIALGAAAVAILPLPGDAARAPQPANR
jgi:PPP family 3-phenylpropionic acid transporter